MQYCNRMQFRSASIQDLPSIVAIYNSTIAGRMVTADTEAVSVESKVEWFHQHNAHTRPLWVVEENHNIIGWVSFKDFYGRPAYRACAEISIYLAAEARGRQLGKQILQYSIAQCSTLGIDTLLAFIFSHNQPSIRLFTQMGFVLWGHLPRVARMDNQLYHLDIYGLKIPHHAST